MGSKNRFLQLLLLVVTFSESLGRTVYNLDLNWKFQLDNTTTAFNCSEDTFPNNLDDQQCFGLTNIPYADSSESCRESCCGDNSCLIWQWCEGGGSDCGDAACWTGVSTSCTVSNGWQGEGRDTQPPSPAPPTECNITETPECGIDFDDSNWRQLNVPHDFVVEGTFNEDADMSHGYLPYGKAYYRKSFSIPQDAQDNTIFLDFDGVMVTSVVYLNGKYIGSHDFGYTPFRFDVTSADLVFGDDALNVLVVYVDATNPDSWWYDGGGIYRHVWLEVANPNAHIAKYGVYASSNVVNENEIIPQTDTSSASADAMLFASVEVENTANTDVNGVVYFKVFFNEQTVNSEEYSEEFSILSSDTKSTVSLNISIPTAQLWSIEYPNLYVLQTNVMIDQDQDELTLVDSVNTTFGVRVIKFDNDTGFYLNGMNVKINGCANHQDFAGLGVALPDTLQDFRVKKMQELGGNAWRTAHNAPTEALLDSTDRLGMLVWDENHRNGQNSQAEVLVLRDRNHPSIIIWSICNEVLCDTGNGISSPASLLSAQEIKDIYEFYDPTGQRPVSANQNEWVTQNSVLDLLGYDYATDNYDRYHNRTPTFPAISSETSSAVSDRSEYANNETTGHVTGYDTEAPSWGQTAEQAWGGIDEPDEQGILTRDFMSGGFVWTGFDYKGEPTPYQWPDINSHFGIYDIAGFDEDRCYWYRAWWKQHPDAPTLYVFPHWNWDTTDVNDLVAKQTSHSHSSHLNKCEGMCRIVKGVVTVEVWVFSEAPQVELFLNGDSLGTQNMPMYGHLSWDVPYTPGILEAYAYNNNNNNKVDGDETDDYLSYTKVETTNEPYSLKASIKDDVGIDGLSNDGSDVAFIQVQVLDNEGRVVPTANNIITFMIDENQNQLNTENTDTERAFIAGTGNGDPSDHTNDKSPTRPAYHGLVLGIIQSTTTTISDDDDDGSNSVVVSVSADGLVGDSLELSIHSTSFKFSRL